MAEPQSLAVVGDMDVVVVTPRGEVSHRAAREVTAFGALGELGVLPGHVPLLTMLEPGVLVLDGTAGREVWAHGPGYLEVGAGDHVKVLVEQAVAASDVDTGDVTTELPALEQELRDFDGADGAERRNLSARRDWAMARLAASARG